MWDGEICQTVEYRDQCALILRLCNSSLLFLGGRGSVEGKRARAVCQETGSEGGYESDEQDLPFHQPWEAAGRLHERRVPMLRQRGSLSGGWWLCPWYYVPSLVPGCTCMYLILSR